MQRGSVNKAILVGHIGSDPESRYTSGGTPVVNLTLATNERRRKSDGTDQDFTEWHKIVLWGRQAEFAANYVKKGALVFIEGRLQTRTWEDRNKVERRTTEIVVDTITLLGSQRSDRDGSEEHADKDAESAGHSPPGDDDIPF